MYVFVFFFKQKTAYEMRISDWSSDVCSSDLDRPVDGTGAGDRLSRRSARRALPSAVPRQLRRGDDPRRTDRGSKAAARHRNGRVPPDDEGAERERRKCSGRRGGAQRDSREETGLPRPDRSAAGAQIVSASVREICYQDGAIRWDSEQLTQK